MPERKGIRKVFNEVRYFFTGKKFLYTDSDTEVELDREHLQDPHAQGYANAVAETFKTGKVAIFNLNEETGEFEKQE